MSDLSRTDAQRGAARRGEAQRGGDDPAHRPVLVPDLIRTTADNDFAHTTMTTRLPRNIANVLRLNPHYAPAIVASLTRLADEIATDAPIPALREPAWDGDRWRALYAPYRDDSWHDTDWFFAETFAFRLILEATRYFETGLDPYAPLKQRELDQGSAFTPVSRYLKMVSSDASLATASPASGFAAARGSAASASGAAHAVSGSARPAPGDPTVAHIVEEALHLCLWGNRADISFTAGGALDHSAGDRDLLICDDTAPVRNLLAGGARNVHIIADNSGAELAGDLVLAHALIRHLDAQVTMHVKFYPTYVSDTLVQDVNAFCAALTSSPDTSLAQFGADITAARDTGSLMLAPDPFWCETEFLDRLPPRLMQPLQSADLIVVKGDFNYRRVVRDTIWPGGTDLTGARGVTLPPMVLLRTMKSDCLAGVSQATIAALDRDAPGWRTDGKRGVIQFIP